MTEPIPVPRDLPKRTCLDCNAVMAAADRVYLMPAFHKPGQPRFDDLFAVIVYVCDACGLTRMYTAVHQMPELRAPPATATS